MIAARPPSWMPNAIGPNDAGPAVGFGSVGYQRRPDGSSAWPKPTSIAPPTASQPARDQRPHGARPSGKTRNTTMTIALTSGRWKFEASHARRTVAPDGATYCRAAAATRKSIAGTKLDTRPIDRNSQPIA